MKSKFLQGLFCFLVIVTLLTPFWIFKDLLFPYITSKAYFLRIMVEISLPLYVMLLLGNKDYRPSFKNPLTIAVVAFLLLNTISAIFGVNPLRSFWGNFERMGGVVYIAHLTLLYFYVVLLGQIGQQYMRAFLVSVIAVAGAIGLDALFIKLTHNHFLLADPSYPRVSGTFGNPIFIASFLIIPMLLTVYYLVAEENRWLQGFYAFLVCLELYVILLSETRGAVVGLAVASFIAAVAYVALTKQKKLRRWGGIAVLVFTVVVVLAFTQHNKFPQGSMLRRVFNLNDSNTSARLIQWKVALKGFKDRPILGVGSENYYFISNAYYNPTIYQYDASWFDKPHNYLIEVLVTSGVLGFAAYLGMLITFIWILWRAYRAQLLTLLEACLLLDGFLAYEFQNLFVFDTISASVMFFVFLGFAGFLWHESKPELPQGQKKKHGSNFNVALVYTAGAVAAVAMAYTIYIANVTGLAVAKDINYGYAYAGVDPQIAKNYFESANNSPFDFDPVQFASKYADFAIGLAANPQKQDPSFVSSNLQDAIEAQQQAINRVPNDPTAWEELANLYLTSAIYNKTGLDPKATDAANEGMKLAPRRPEPELMAARLDIAQNNFSGAEGYLQDIANNIPQDKDAQWQLALVYYYSGDVHKGLEIAAPLLAAGYLPPQTAQVDWMALEYAKENNISAAADIYALEIKIDPSDLNAYWQLAQDDIKLGKKSEAAALLQQLIAADPKDTQQFQALLNTIQ